jgi:hypothetical protein
MPFNQVHLDALKACPDFNQGPVGHYAYNWGIAVVPQNFQLNEAELNRRFDRQSLINYCHHPETDNLHATIAILAWGGRDRPYGRRIFENWETLEPIISNLRNNFYQTRSAAFQAFYTKRINGELPGLGIAFFTKLICFLPTNFNNAYILDQWTGKSINLLVKDGRFINIQGNAVVDRHNNAEIYERFCAEVDNLADELEIEGIDAEKRIFSWGGRNKGPWRNYLINIHI